ncbi:MAG: signal peptidase I [Alphaproteobacteria bacterium]|nr:signal peptidase I [Alphaproteobacteria bacterium]
MSRKRDRGGLGETIRTVVYAVLIALVIRTFAYEPFNIPSESMLPTLLVGDYLFVSKYSYGYSRYSLPWGLPLFEGRLWQSEPRRGDVAVFKLPSDNSTDYIKRIVGLPGDRIQMRDGRLFINDQSVVKVRAEDFIYERNGQRFRVPRFVETLPGGPRHDTLDFIAAGEHDTTREFVIPAGHYFAMGDNRDNSLDSRARGGVGMVPAENLVGRAEFLFFSTDGSARLWEFWRWPFAIRFDRLFKQVSD